MEERIVSESLDATKEAYKRISEETDKMFMLALKTNKKYVHVQTPSVEYNESGQHEYEIKCGIIASNNEYEYENQNRYNVEEFREKLEGLNIDYMNMTAEEIMIKLKEGEENGNE